MMKNALSYISFALFIALLVLGILEFFGQSDILSASTSEYLDFLKKGTFPIVSAVILFFSLGVARIITYGLFRLINKKLKTRLFWFSFAILFIVQFVAILLMRTGRIETP